MSVCEACWKEAYIRSRFGGNSQTEEYYLLLKERKSDLCVQDQATNA